MDELWKDIENYEGLYQVSNLGRVKSLQRRVPSGMGNTRLVNENILKFGVCKGYYVVTFSKNVNKNINKGKTYRVSRLVANAFITNVDNCLEVNHINGDKFDNKISNLEWLTHKKNQEHAIKNKLYKMFPVVKIENSVIVERFPSINEAARKYNLGGGNVWGICEGRRKQTKGHYFQYEK
jgi:hypothetical protein